MRETSIPNSYLRQIRYAIILTCKVQIIGWTFRRHFKCSFWWKLKDLMKKKSCKNDIRISDENLRLPIQLRWPPSPLTVCSPNFKFQKNSKNFFIKIRRPILLEMSRIHAYRGHYSLSTNSWWGREDINKIHFGVSKDHCVNF